MFKFNAVHFGCTIGFTAAPAGPWILTEIRSM
jgi:hypothetical protein